MNAGVLGSGLIASVFTKQAQAFKDIHLRALWGRHEEKITSFAPDYDYVTTDLDRILNDEEIDLIYIGLPNALHYTYAKKVLEAGKNLLLEKPFTVTLKEAEELFALAEEKGLLCLEAATIMYNHSYLSIKEEIGKLGEIRLVEANFSQYSRRYERFKQGIIEPVFNKDMAGGALYDLNVYNIHFLVGIFGMPQKVSYYPNVVRGVDTSGVLVLDYGTFKASLIAAKDCQAESHVSIQGDEACLLVKGTASRCAAYDIFTPKKERTSYVSEDDEFIGFHDELEVLTKLMKKRDKAQEERYKAETLQVMKILEEAMRSSGLDYGSILL